MRYVLRGLYAFHVDSSSMPLRPFIPWALQNQEGTPEKNSKRMDTDWVDCVTKKTWRLPSTLFSLWVLLVRSFRVRLFAWDFEIFAPSPFLGLRDMSSLRHATQQGKPPKTYVQTSNVRRRFKRESSALFRVFRTNPTTPVSDLGIDFCEPPTRISVR